MLLVVLVLRVVRVVLVVRAERVSGERAICPGGRHDDRGISPARAGGRGRER
jgi:hypothetical protein